MRKLRTTLSDRLPTKESVFATFGLILLIVHSHSLIQYFYRVPSFLKYLDVINISAVLAYFMAFAFLESLLVLSGLLILAIILPRSWYAVIFEVINLPVLIVMSIAAYEFQSMILNTYAGIALILELLGIAVVGALVFAVIFARTAFLRKIARMVMDRVSMMNYIYIPIGVLSLLVVIFRLLV